MGWVAGLLCHLLRLFSASAKHAAKSRDCQATPRPESAGLRGTPFPAPHHRSRARGAGQLLSLWSQLAGALPNYATPRLRLGDGKPHFPSYLRNFIAGSGQKHNLIL